jgi:hypothetical protein
MTLTANKYGFPTSFRREQTFFGKTECPLNFELKLDIFQNS